MSFSHFHLSLIVSNVSIHLITIIIFYVIFRVGASVTLTEMGDFLKEQIEKHPKWKTRVFKTIVEMLYWFAGKQIRSVGAIGGNLKIFVNKGLKKINA